MGRERQKKKRKSSTPKVRSNRKSKRINPKSNPLVAAKWDQSLTLAQNYRRLGLTAKLNTRAGGVQKTISEIPDSDNTLPKRHQDPLAITPKSSSSLLPPEIRVEKDPETGVILRITDPNWSQSQNPLNDPLNDILDADTRFNDDAREPGGIIKELEEQASVEIKKKPRHQSQREMEWIERLVEKHGDEFEQMARDMKLNPYQQTAADIRRRVIKWAAV